MVNSVISSKALTDGALRYSLQAVQPSATPPSSVTKAIALDPQTQAQIQALLDVATPTDKIVETVVQLRVQSQQPVDDKARQEIVNLVAQEVTAYQQRVTQEFKGFSSHVRACFANAAANYFPLREAMIKAGYQNPAKTVFGQIQSGASFLGHRVVGGLHQEFIDRLADLQAELEKQAPGTAAKVAAEIQQVQGFVPGVLQKNGRFVTRVVEGSNSLSNHAFGLAIDLDPPRNPRIFKSGAIKVLNWVVRELKFDFGKAIEASVSWGDAAAVTRLHEKAAAASDKLKAWLQQYLPVYTPLAQQLSQAEAALKAAEKKLKQAKQAKKNAKPDSDAAKQATADITALQTEIAAKQAVIKTTQETIDKDENLKNLQALAAYHGEQLADWSQYGIQSIPLALAVAMNALRFTWGQQYKSSKDAMHFELEAAQVISKSG